MSKASKYAAQFEVPQPKFVARFIDDDIERPVAMVDSYGRMVILMHAAALAEADALRLRDWITENFDEDN